MELLLATRNQHKTREFNQLLGNEFRVIDLSSTPEVVLPEETGQTFAENATLKAISVSKQMAHCDVLAIVIADDSGLEVDALDGAPGIYSARYAGECASDAQNVDKLLGQLKGITERSVRFRCVVALARDGKVLGTFEGIVEGSIIDSPRGTGGFGYDPVFRPNGFDQTFAEMGAELKNKISHRAKAAAALRDALRRMEN